MHYACKYESLKGREIHSIKPFGKIANSESDYNSHLIFQFQKFSTAGTSGIKDVEISDHTFEFELPKSMTNADHPEKPAAPWAKAMENEKLMALEGKVSKDKFKELGTNKVNFQELKKWLEDDAKSLKPVSVTALNSE